MLWDLNRTPATNHKFTYTSPKSSVESTTICNLIWLFWIMNRSRSRIKIMEWLLEVLARWRSKFRWRHIARLLWAAAALPLYVTSDKFFISNYKVIFTRYRGNLYSVSSLSSFFLFLQFQWTLTQIKKNRIMLHRGINLIIQTEYKSVSWLFI